MPSGAHDSFLWGAATAAFQIEGAPDADGKGPSIWDVFCHTPGKTNAGETGDMACDHYRRWRADVDLMRALHLNGYRFSIAWPRVLPTGRGAINTAGLDFYDRLVDALCAANITPLVTLYHWDLPAALQMELGGWTHPDLPMIFADYARIVFERLADRVPLWLTLNEPWVVVEAGHRHGTHAPGIRDDALAYRAGHNLLRAHAYAVAEYRQLPPRTGSAISLALNSTYCFPASQHPDDVAAAERALLNFAGWFGDPPWFGDYPAVLRERLGDLLPPFTPEDTRLLQRSMDFVALNYYFSDVIRYTPGAGPMDAEVVPQLDCAYTEMGWPITPEGLTELLLWLHRRYGRLPLYVTENGAALPDTADETGFVHDPDRIAYLREHLLAIEAARTAGAEVRGYFAWSLLDNLEWSAGFSKRFGLIHCDPHTQKRTVKASGKWYAELIATGGWSALRRHVGRTGQVSGRSPEEVVP
ncbi:MAG: beta-glucosidase [Phycisphaerales bacterium]|nr:beta-glucosidase [Phycisphaerales bacterium]